MRTLSLALILLCAGSVTGCGKTLAQLQKSAKDAIHVADSAIDIAGAIYADSVENTKTAKEAVSPTSGK